MVRNKKKPARATETKRFSILDVVNAWLPPGFRLSIPPQNQGSEVRIVRDLTTFNTPEDGARLEDLKRKVKDLLIRAAAEISPEEKKRLVKETWDLQQAFFTEKVYTVLPDPTLRLELHGPLGPYFDQHGTLHLKHPPSSRISRFSWDEPTNPKGGRPRISSSIKAEVKRLHAKRRSQRGIVNYLRAKGTRISRPTVAQIITEIPK